MRRSNPLLATLLAVGSVHGATIEDCKSLASRLTLANTTVYQTTFISAGTKIALPDNHPSCTTPSQVTDADICRVALLTVTGPRSNISMEAWLPLDWSGRFLGTGNGGMNGCIKYEDLNYGASHQFATIGTNNGHNGSSGAPFYENPGVVEDYVYRSVHLEAQIGKEIAQEFYGKNHTKAYYIGCSTGGRQGFKEAQSFPGDFDGIVAGAPAFDFNGLMYWTGRLYVETGINSTKTLSSAQWNLVYADVMRQCDGLDGLVDGIIEDTDLCQYRPEGLVCSDAASKSDTCLSGEQVETVRAVFSPTYDSQGQVIYPRLQPGSRSTGLLIKGQPPQYPSDWWRYALYNDTEWDVSTLNLQDYENAQQRDLYGVSTFKGDLSEAKQLGVKILHYHGLEDPLISSDNSARYYNLVSRTMNLSPAEMDDFYRFFRISGMSHCSGGTGASSIGGSTNTFSSYDADSNVLAAMVRWVEEGVAPDTIQGSRLTASGKVDLQRKHCKYPARNVWTGQGDPTKPDGWKCI